MKRMERMRLEVDDKETQRKRTRLRDAVLKAGFVENIDGNASIIRIISARLEELGFDTGKHSTNDYYEAARLSAALDRIARLYRQKAEYEIKRIESNNTK